MIATTTSTRSSPSRWAAPRLDGRPAAARAPAGLRADSRVGTVRVIALTMAATIVTLMTVDVTVTALPMPLSASGPTLPRMNTTSAARGTATMAATIASIADSVRAMKARCVVEAPRDRMSARSVRRRSSSMPATSTIA